MNQDTITLRDGCYGYQLNPSELRAGDIVTVTWDYKENRSMAKTQRGESLSFLSIEALPTVPAVSKPRKPKKHLKELKKLVNAAWTSKAQWGYSHHETALAFQRVVDYMARDDVRKLVS